jgi:hypothetical protein
LEEGLLVIQQGIQLGIHRRRTARLSRKGLTEQPIDEEIEA